MNTNGRENERMRWYHHDWLMNLVVVVVAGAFIGAEVWFHYNRFWMSIWTELAVTMVNIVIVAVFGYLLVRYIIDDLRDWLDDRRCARQTTQNGC